MEHKNCPNYFWCYIHKPISLLCHAIAVSLSLSPVLRTGQFLSKLFRIELRVQAQWIAD